MARILCHSATPLAPTPGKTAQYVVVTGNPNCGKTTLFNALTGLRAKVGNYPGVTVERKEGRMSGAPPDSEIIVLDLPGTYSLSPHSPDEQVARDVLFHRVPEVPAPSLVVVTADASNLQRNLYLATQIIELGFPTLIALNMIDVARENGHEIDSAKLADALGVPVLPVVASSGHGLPALRQAIVEILQGKRPAVSSLTFVELPAAFETEARKLAAEIRSSLNLQHALAQAILMLSDDRFLSSSHGDCPSGLTAMVQAARRRLLESGIDWRSAPIESRYRRLSLLQQAVTVETAVPSETSSDRLDRCLTHKVWGLLVFMVILAAIFQSIFFLARLPMEALEHGVDWLGHAVGTLIPPGALHSLLVDGVISGVGAVVVFLPQICLLFLFLGLLEDTGYMARAAFLMDRLMSKVGLHGRSFIPMLSSFACAIPGIMATRTIENPRDRLVTILVAPLMSCSARLPVYTILIAACLPDRQILGPLRLPGLALLSMYGLGILAALGMAWVFKRTLLRGPTPMLIMELPPYRRPLLRTLARHVWDRAKVFLTQAGTIILSINIVLWFLVSYPKSSQTRRDFETRRAAVTRSAQGDADAAVVHKLDQLNAEERGEILRGSIAGRMGRLLEPAIAPLGFDWKIGVGIISSFAAREVFVSTMSQVYNVGDYKNSSEGLQSLSGAMRLQRRPDGTPLYTPLTGIALMVFYVFALQCASTVAIVRRETNSWKWPLVQWLYLGLLAWIAAFLTFQGGRLLGWQ